MSDPRLESLVARLEKAVAALETIRAAGGPAASVAAAALHGGAEEKAASPSLTAYDEFFAKNIAPFVETCRKTEGTKIIGDQAETAFKRMRDLVEATTACKKPSQGDLLKFLNPVVQVVTKAGEQTNVASSPVLNHLKAWGETVQIFNWVFVPTPVASIKESVEAAEFWTVKILHQAKTASSADEQKTLRDFVTQIKALVLALADYVKAFHTTGPAWNAKGIELTAFKPGASAAAGAAPAAPPAPAGGAVPPPPPVGNFVIPPPPPVGDAVISAAEPAKPAPSGMAAVFSDLNKGEAITSGLRKVTSDMKSKNMKDVPVLQPKNAPSAAAGASSSAAPKAVAVASAKAPPKLELRQGNWFCENFENQTIEIPDVQMKQGVYVFKAVNATVVIPAKCKSVQVDSCSKSKILVHSVVSTLEIVNSQRVQLIAQDACPSIALDKSHGIGVILSKAALAANPDIVSSNVSEVNVEIPGKTDQDDPVELALPEQLITKVREGKLVTSVVEHHG